MTTYTVSYFIKDPTKFEEGATVTEMGNEIGRAHV